MKLHIHHRRSSRKGYVMLIALILMAILAVIGATTLSISGVDQRIALYNRKHMMVLNTADAGTIHARDVLRVENPEAEWTADTDTGGYLIDLSEGETEFGGSNYPQNLGVYRVRAIFLRSGSPPPGYSTEMGNQEFRADYWRVESTASMKNPTLSGNVNETSATVASTIRKVAHGRAR